MSCSSDRGLIPRASQAPVRVDIVQLSALQVLHLDQRSLTLVVVPRVDYLRNVVTPPQHCADHILLLAHGSQSRLDKAVFVAP